MIIPPADSWAGQRVNRVRRIELARKVAGRQLMHLSTAR